MLPVEHFQLHPFQARGHLHQREFVVVRLLLPLVEKLVQLSVESFNRSAHQATSERICPDHSHSLDALLIRVIRGVVHQS